MAIPVYADSADYATWSGSASPSNIARLLRSASLLVQEAIAGAIYVTDDDGAPTDETVIQALSDATCAQIEVWQTAKVDPASGGVPQTGLLASKGLDGASVSYDNTANSSSAGISARQQLIDQLCDESVRILQAANLANKGPWTFG